ncbi:MAG: hypothetical protein L6R39_002639 [Caloplaca ligustica]|nr:MAG: hypothetical protein L6R39_002639 [Caloplaca ligustica]
MPFRRQDAGAMARRIKDELEEEDRRLPPQPYGVERKYGEQTPRYRKGPIYEAPNGYQAYPEHRASPQYKPEPKLERQPRQEARRGRGENNNAGYAQARAANLGPLECQAQSPGGAGLFGPTVREGALADFDPDHPPYREVNHTTYKFIKTVGVGGQGHADLYQSTRDGTYRVCKTMRRAGYGTPMEASILMDILDPHRRIIEMRSFICTNYYTHFWYEYCPNGDLQDLMDAYTARRAKIPESFIWHVYMQVADALAYIHTGYDRLLYDGGRPPSHFKPIVHRDVKPPNIFLRPNGGSIYPDLVLADFGLATTETRSGERFYLGTPVWQPPELPLHTPQSDIWSLGACIHAMATGSPPLKAAPKGFKSDWLCEPEARMVADLKKFGYSKQLDDTMYQSSMRTCASERLMGMKLVKRVRKGYAEWAGQDTALKPWALKR